MVVMVLTKLPQPVTNHHLRESWSRRRMKSSRRLAVWLLAGLCITGTAQLLRAADWQAPKDELVTEKELTNYFQVQKEAIDNWRAAGKAIEGSQSSNMAIAPGAA